MRWTLIVEQAGRAGAENMGIDFALLRRAQEGDAFLRLYGWSPPCLSFGRNEPVTRRYDVARIRASGIATVRRPTGGRAVWHDREVTYAVAAPVTAFGSLRRAYHHIHRVLATGLESLGVPATLAPPPHARTPLAGSCFASPMGGEILVAGRKLAGSAQYRHHGALLQHGSILLENGQDRVSDFLLHRTAPPAAVSLTDVLGRPVTPREVAAALIDSAQAAWSGEWIRRETLEPDPGGPDFADPDWTWRR